LIWSLVALGGAGLWLSAADPIFGGPDLLPAAFTLLGFFAVFGAAATLLIWRWPTVWKRWFQAIPSEESWQLELASRVSHLAFWILAIGVVIGLVALRWSAMAAGAVGGCLVLGHLALDDCFHHWLSKRQ
jgi:hypothetical protein